MHSFLSSSRVAVLAALTALLGCTNGVATSAPRAFNRPARMAFVCFDVSDSTSPRAVPLAECQPTAYAVDTSGRQTFATNRLLHALVTQTTRGEVAAVDLTNRRVLDSDSQIPGATFVPVGELPTDIVVPERNPNCAWVASAGDRTISSIPAPRFRPEHDRGIPDYITQVRLPGRPGDLMLSADETTLWVALPDLGAVARLAIDPVSCVSGAPDVIELTADVPAPVLPQPGADYRRVCPEDLDVAEPATLVPSDPLFMEAPRPTALEIDHGAVDSGDEILLVADSALPLIHRVDMRLGVELAPLAVGAPIRDLALTPWVPDSDDLADPTVSRFLYAIDDTDGTILAVDYGDPSDAGFGAVLPVDGAQSLRPNRMPIPVGARAIDILTPGYQVDAIDPRVPTASADDVYDGLCRVDQDREDPLPRPSTLRGVFLSMAMADGTVRIADIYDLDAPCRGRAFGAGVPVGDPLTCGSPNLASDTNVYIRRHRLRAGVFLTNLASVFDGPTFVVNGANLRVSREGSGGPTPLLAPTTCPAGMGTIFPSALIEGESTRICSQLDPFAAAAETWVAGWQGALPATAGSGGNFEDVGDEVHLEVRTDLCARGVLSVEAAAAVPADQPETGYVGDVVAITTPIDPDVLQFDPTCQGVVGTSSAGGTAQPILIPITRAFSRPAGLIEPYVGRLVLAADAPIIDAATGLPRSNGTTLADARRCLRSSVVDGVVVDGREELVSYDIRARRAYTVSGSRTGFLHRIVAGADGVCALDATLPVTRNGRAFHEVPFENPRIAFLISLLAADVTPPGVGTELRFRIGIVDSRFGSVSDAQLRVDLGDGGNNFRLLTLPSEVRWNDLNQHLFVLDPERRGLVEIATPSMSVVGGTRFE